MNFTYTILYVNDVEKSVRFYEQCFNLKSKFIHESGDYAEIDTGSTTLGFCNHQLANKIVKDGYTKSSLSTSPQGSQITFTPEDVKTAYSQAIANGAKPLSRPEIKPWNFEVAIVRDIDGHLIELAKNLNS